jgi:heat shock protein HslJ
MKNIGDKAPEVLGINEKGEEIRLSAYKGCNLINGGFETSTTNAKSISFPGVASTMMACPDMEVEGKILKAMNEVKSFDKLSGGGIGLYDANNALVIVLEK